MYLLFPVLRILHAEYLQNKSTCPGLSVFVLGVDTCYLCMYFIIGLICYFGTV